MFQPHFICELLHILKSFLLRHQDIIYTSNKHKEHTSVLILAQLREENINYYLTSV